MRRRVKHASIAYRLVAAFVRPLMFALTKRDWRGGENIPASGGVIIAGNHLSYFDPLAMAHYVHDHGRHVRYLAKEEVFRMPVFGALIRAAGQIPVRRESPDAAIAFAAAEQALRDGHCIVVYPEGTLTIDPDLWPLQGKSGAVRLALATGVPIVPVAQWGPQEVITPHTSKFRPFPRKTMHILAGPAVDLSEFAGATLDAATLAVAADRVQAQICDLLSQLRGVPAPPERMSRTRVKELQRREAQERREAEERRGRR
jgi:1-acyl-sn-glycerol-3-phosphate acyltransferase